MYEVLREKYEWTHQRALAFQDFLLPMLEFDPADRATAADCLKHPWITGTLESGGGAVRMASSPAAAQEQFSSDTDSSTS